MKLKIALLSACLSVGLHFYLTSHFYALNFGFAEGESICNVSDKFNCDTVTASAYSSVFGTPVAIWGASANLILAILILGWMLNFSTQPTRLQRYTKWLAAIIASTSLIMGSISTFVIGSYCLFCIATYLLSFISFGLIYSSQENNEERCTDSFKALFKDSKVYLAVFITVPILAMFLHKTYVMKFGATELNRTILGSVSDWVGSPKVDLKSVAPAMSKGPADAKIVIDEFADFRCSHCKQAGHGLKAFFNSRPDIQMNFYLFPLDGTCNPAIPGGGGDGLSCLLAKNVLCAEKTSKQGWGLHDHFFKIQYAINSNGTRDFVQAEIAKALTQLNIPSEDQKKCVESAETDTIVRAHAKLGSDSGVRGTPSIYVNGQKLNKGQLLPVLEAVYLKITKTE
jgi:protein-disulfide isomerase/uncharacterized membrane protein